MTSALRIAINAGKHTDIARIFLCWFETNATHFTDAVYAPGTDYVERYFDGARLKNAIDYVAELAGERLPEKDAQAVIEEARKLLRPNG